MRSMLASVLLVAAATGSARAADGLPGAVIAGGIANVNAKILACGDKSQTGGTVQAQVQVAPDGKVTSVTADGSGDPALDACVAEIIATITFKTTKAGGGFSYPFVFVAKTAPVADLDYDAIAVGIERVSDKIDACQRNKWKLTSTSTSWPPAPEAFVNVGANGKITKIAVDTGPVGGAACIERVFKTVTFPTRKGGSFLWRGLEPFGGGELILTDPGELDGVAVEDGVSKVEIQIRACVTSKGGATVMAHVLVGADGKVTGVTAGDSKRDICVAGVLKTATFKATKTGGGFQYPFRHWFVSQGTARDELDLAAITHAIATVKSKIFACGTKSKHGGTVKANIQVGPDGKVSSATTDGSSDAALDKCVGGVLKATTFQRTKMGGSFLYPFVF